MKKIPYWIKFSIIFTVVVVSLTLLEILTAESLEFGTFLGLFTIIPTGIILEVIGLDVDKFLIPGTLILIFAIGSMFGALIGLLKKSK